MAQEVGNYQNTSVPMGLRLNLFFRTIISGNQLSIYGAVSDLCDEYRICKAKTESVCCQEKLTHCLSQ